MLVRTIDAVRGDAKSIGKVVRAVVITSPDAGGRAAFSAGDTVSAIVTAAGVESTRGRRHFLELQFQSIRTFDGTVQLLDARVSDVPNARETVDSTGRILGPVQAPVLRSRSDWAAVLLGTVQPVAGAVLFAAFRGSSMERHRAIVYPVGVEMSLRLRRPLTLAAVPAALTLPAADSTLLDALRDAPVRAVTQKKHVPADVITLALSGTRAQVEQAFRAAGWTAPKQSSLRADLALVFDAARAKGFAEQPMSELLLNGVAPSMAFEKVVNSLARRHHLRIWEWDHAADGTPIWLVAATRDDGLIFSRARRRVTHRVDPAIDLEQRKVIDDLLAARVVSQWSYLQRTAPSGPVLLNDGKSPVRTDWRMAVLQLASP